MTTLTELKLGSLALTPEFAEDTTDYAATTTNASNTLTVTPTSDDVEITVMLGETEVDAGADGKYSLTWVEGSNTVTVKVDADGVESTTYTLTVTAS